MTDSAYLTLGSATNRYLTRAAGTDYYLTRAAGTDYYLTLNDPAPYDNDVAVLLAEATWYIDSHAANFYGPVPNMGTAGATLNAQVGSSASGAVQVVPSSGYVYLPGVAGNRLQVASSPNVTGDFDLRVNLALDDWTPSAIQGVVGKRGTSNAYEFRVETTGLLYFAWYESGTTWRTVYSSVTTGFSDGARKWIRVTLDVNNGAGTPQYEVKFWTSDDNVTYAQLGSTTTGATGVTNIPSTSDDIMIGERLALTSPTAGKVYRAIVKDGIDGTTVLDIDCADASTQSPLFTASTGQTVTINVSGSDTNDPKWLAYDGTPYVWLPGVASNYLSVPDAASLDIVGDLDLICRVSVDSLATQYRFINKNGTTTNGGYSLNLLSSGFLQMQWSTGAAGVSVAATASCASVGIVVGQTYWLRATLDVDSGGVYQVAFYFAADQSAVPSSWTQIGTTVSGGATTSIGANATQLAVGSWHSGSTDNVSGRIHRAIVKDGIDGTTVLDVDTSVITTGAATSFTEQSSNAATVTINRTTSGRKSVAVVEPVWAFGTDDFLQVPDDDAIDFGASDSFTVLAVHRAWATQGTNDVLLAKKANTTATTAGWSLTGGSSTALQGQSQVGDGTNGITAVSGSRTSGALATVAAVRSVSADTLTVYLSGTAGTSVADTTTGSLANAEVMRVGRLSGAGTEYGDFEFIAAAIWRRALTAGEIAGLSTYFSTRAYNG